LALENEYLQSEFASFLVPPGANAGLPSLPRKGAAGKLKVIIHEVKQKLMYRSMWQGELEGWSCSAGWDSLCTAEHIQSLMNES
jgi:hypothetical protein